MFVSHDTPSIFLLLILLFLNVLLLYAKLCYSYLFAILYHAVSAQLEEAGGGGGEGDGLGQGVVGEGAGGHGGGAAAAVAVRLVVVAHVDLHSCPKFVCQQICGCNKRASTVR